jgi:MFS family permease
LVSPRRAHIPALVLLEDHNFLAFWVAGILNSTARRMEVLTLSLYVLDATDSAFQLGLIWVFIFLPKTILSPVTGVIADRVSRQRIIQGSQVFNLLIAAAILSVFAADLIQVWHVFLAVFLQGCNRAMEDATRRPAIPDIVSSERLVAGFSLEIIGLTIGRLGGPIIAGVMVGTAGFTESYISVIVVHILALGALARVRIPTYRVGASMEPFWRSLQEGVRFIWHRPILIGVLYVTFVMNALFFPIQQFIPAVGRDHLEIGPVLVGLLVAAEGFGRLLTGGILAVTRGPRNHSFMCTAAAILVMIVTLLFAWSPWFALSFTFLVISGIGLSGFSIMQNIITVRWTPQEMRGRVTGLRGFFVGFGNPMGALAIGGIASSINVQWAIAATALVGLILLLPSLILTPLAERTSIAEPQATTEKNNP